MRPVLTLPARRKAPALKLWCLIITLAVLTACQSSPERSLQGDSAPEYDLSEVPEILAKAENAPAGARAPLLLDAVDILLAHDEIDWARNIITGLSPSSLEDATYARHQLLAARVAVKSGYLFAAEQHLTEPRLAELLPQLSAEDALPVREQRAQLFSSLGNFAASVEERAALDQLLQQAPDVIEEERQLNHDLLWETLMQLSHRELGELRDQATDQTLAGWYQLASISKSNQSNLNRQLALVDSWAQEHPNHPASKRLPADLQLLRDLVAHQPQRVALLLPLGGKLEQAAAAVRDGFMAAYYDAAQNGEPLPDIRVYDTSTQSVNEVYDRALLEGAEAVVGPLEKESIAELALRSELPVPTLALNSTELPEGSVQQLYQFGLAVEDEAEQVAQRAWEDGHRRALIFAPRSTWGDRSVDTFWQQWQQMGGEVARDYRFNDEDGYLNILASALHITDSRGRAQQLRRLLGRSLEFEPRRRQDIDMIFLVAYPQQARQIKPTLAFHYAGNVPVYATSQIYGGDEQNNQDMNGVRFTSLPWFFEQDAPEKQALDRYANVAPTYQRLYAMGADAYHLYPRLRQLREVSGARYYGYTGALSLDQHGRIERQQIWAQFSGGRAQVMPTLREDDN